MALLGTPTVVRAERGFDLELLRPAGGVRDLVVTSSPAVAQDLEVGGGMLLSYARRPLIVATLQDGSYRRTEVIADHRVVGDLYASMGLLGRLEMSVALPVGLHQEGPGLNGGELTAAGIGDVRLGVKVVLVDPGAGGFGAALTPQVSFPSGDPGDLRGDGFLTVSPALAVGHIGRRHRVAAEAGVTLREGGRVRNLEVGQQVFYRAGVGWFLAPRLEVLAELAGLSAAQGLFKDEGDGLADESPLEALGSARISVTGDLHMTVGGGAGMIAGYGAPQYRVFGGASWAPTDRDRDGDGRPDRADDCPDAPEDRDGFADADGCPDPDNDDDGVPDVVDECPTPAGAGPDALWSVAEDRDGHEDADGCPDPDNDGDGVEDDKDDCPNKAEDLDGFDDADGCPELDNDDDGVPDDRDDCPTEKEDIDGRLDDDGCPDPDNDGDGLPDERDSCPLAAEDRDGFEDADGCPDPDNDDDGIADALDFCPDEAEDLDGVTDTDGCPDEPGRSRLVAIRKGQIIPLEPVEYEKDTAVLLPASERILDEVARVLTEHPELGDVRIEAHLDAKGDPDERRALTQRQALAVMRYLVLRGVDPTRLVAQGLGPDRPIDTRGTPEGRAANRRIEFQAVTP